MQGAAATDDKRSAALLPYPKYEPQPGPRSRYIRYEFKARTLGQLQKWAGDDGAGAVAEAMHYALSAWLMNSPHSTAENLSAVASRWEHLRAVHCIPRLTNRPWQSRLAYMAPADRKAVEVMAADLLAQWEAAGSPGLHRAIERTQQTIHSARMAAEDRQTAREAVELIFQKEAPWPLPISSA